MLVIKEINKSFGYLGEVERIKLKLWDLVKKERGGKYFKFLIKNFEGYILDVKEYRNILVLIKYVVFYKKNM